jgi:hypothetical protein
MKMKDEIFIHSFKFQRQKNQFNIFFLLSLSHTHWDTQAEYDKAKRERQIGEEEKFAEAIKDLKEDEIRESAFRQVTLNLKVSLENV